MLNNNAGLSTIQLNLRKEIKGVIRSSKSKKGTHYNGQNEKE